MKRFLLKFAVFSLVCLTGCVGMDLLFSRRYQQSAQPLYAAWYDLMHGRVQAKVIVNGNSRAWALLSPAILDSVLNTTSYNLGIDGSALPHTVTSVSCVGSDHRAGRRGRSN